MKNTKKIEFKPLTPIDGNRSEAVNVRRRGDWMEVTGTPAAVCPKTTDDRFLGADRRGSRTYYFMQRNGKDVIMSGYRQDGTFTAVQRTLFADGGSVTGFAVSGEFVVMSTSAGLRYLHFNGSGYDSLGGMVEMPEFAFGTITSATISTDIAGITLKGSYPQWKGTLAASDRSGVERAFRSAISELQTVASAGGCCLQPVVLRVALRLWDDSLLWSGAAACVGHAWQPDTSSSVPPTTARSVAQPTTLLHSTGNPLQWTECTRADNAGVHGVMPTLRYGATWIIGRSPVCLLSADGIRLLSFDTSGRCTASTRISQRIVASSRLAAVTENGLAFIDSNGQLCRYEGTHVTSTGVTVPSAEGLVYSASHGELLVYGGGKTMAVAPDNTFTHRTSRYQSHASGLLSDSDNVYDPDIEEKSAQAVDLRTDQTELPFRLRLAQWHIDASDADVRLTVYAENGYSCHGEMVSSQRLRGAVRAVVRQRVAMPRSRTVRFGLQGTLPSGTRIGNINMS